MILILSYLSLGFILGIVGAVYVWVTDHQRLPWWYMIEAAIAWPYLLLSVLFD